MSINEEKDLELMHQLDDLFREVRSRIHSYWARNGSVGIGINHARLLTMIAEEGAMKASNLAERLHITCGAVTGLADKLIENGLLMRAKDPNDRRVVMLTLTELGKERAEEISVNREQLMTHLFAHMSNEEMKFGLHLFTKLQNNLASLENENENASFTNIKQV